MSEPAQINEPLENRAASWLNGVMYYGLVSLLTLAAVWIFLGSFSSVRSVVDARFFPQQAVPREASALFALTGLTALIGRSRRRGAAK